MASRLRPGRDRLPFLTMRIIETPIKSARVFQGRIGEAGRSLPSQEWR